MLRAFSFFRQAEGWRTRGPLLLLLAVFLSSASLFAKTVTLNATDNNTSICLIEGDTLVIVLPSPMPDAYRWEQHLGKPSALTVMHDDYAAPKDPKGSGSQTFRFNAASVGSANVTLGFRRQKAAEAPEVTQTFSVDVSVTTGNPQSSVLIGIYEGTTACADCTGIQTKLRLYAKGKNDFTDTIFVSTRTYVGGRNGDQTFTDRGEWTVMKGDAADPNATVYALNPSHWDQAQYMLLEAGGGALTELDRQMKPIDAPPQYRSILKRME